MLLLKIYIMSTLNTF